MAKAKKQLGAFKVQTAQEILALLKHSQLTPQYGQKTTSYLPTPPPSNNWPRIRFRNDSGETVPKFGVMQVYDAFIDPNGNHPVLMIKKPDGTVGAPVLFNGPNEIADGKRFIGFREGRALYQDAELVLGDTWGPAADSWALSKGKAGFKAIADLAEGSGGPNPSVGVFWLDLGEEEGSASASSSSSSASASQSFSESSSESASSSASSSSAAECITHLGGVDLSALPIELEPDLVLGFKDGCLVLVPVTPCVPSDSSSSSSSSSGA